eukprot:CAMPEP_0197029582 /NCGR_PEP_ID=MMETSP1384-20130603/9006_1 /TAXON_ID=29189 /ORGANISM="Ammonia sp." /LENGTH=399 /DNA_ID=CAMNT_0042458783 /DNA_START=36 /DNA_END=1232 /DNA_ORIENTATION=+
MATVQDLQVDTKLTIINEEEEDPDEPPSPVKQMKQMTPLREYKPRILARIPSSYRICLVTAFIFSLLLILSFSSVYLLTSTPSNCSLCDFQYTSCIVTNLTLNASSSCPLRVEFLYGLNNDWDQTQTVCDFEPFSTNEPVAIGQMQTCVIKDDDDTKITNINYPIYEETNLLSMQIGWIYLTFLFSGVFVAVAAAAWSAWMCCKPSADPAVIQERDHSCICLCIFCVGLTMLFLMFYLSKQLGYAQHAADTFDENQVYNIRQCTIRGIRDVEFYSHSDRIFGSNFSVVFYEVELVGNEHDRVVAAQIDHDLNLTEQDLEFVAVNETADYGLIAELFGLLAENSTQRCYENVDTAQIILATNEHSQPKVDWLENHIEGMSKSFDPLKIAFVLIVCPCIYW